MTIKQRQRSGYTTPKSTLKTSKEEIISECLEPEQHWDDWNDYRDGMRDYLSDKTKIKSKSLLGMMKNYNEDNFVEFDKNNKKIKKINKRKHLHETRPV